MKLLSRQEFREGVLARDRFCVICGTNQFPLDAHHIIERRLWPDGGYYFENGAALCDRGEDGCHYKAETTEITVEQVREAAGIDKICLPPDMYSDTIYDKWGNEVLEDGTKTIGPLFHDPSVQKVLEKGGHTYRQYTKYPRTWHLPWSPGVTKDDRVLRDLSAFEGRQVVVTEKMDGENFTGYSDGYTHARSVDGRSHPSRDWAKNAWAQRGYQLPQGWRACMENLYAVHSLRYEALPSYLAGFSIWDETNTCLSWSDTVEWYELLDIPTVPVLWEGEWNEAFVKRLECLLDLGKQEGYVVRVADSFSYREFSTCVGKFVRANHVTTDRHWMRGRRIEPNQLGGT